MSNRYATISKKKPGNAAYLDKKYAAILLRWSGKQDNLAAVHSSRDRTTVGTGLVGQHRRAATVRQVRETRVKVVSIRPSIDEQFRQLAERFRQKVRQCQDEGGTQVDSQSVEVYVD